MNVVYMGTPEFAVEPLKALASSEHTVACVITGPDKPAGRGRKLLPTPVKSAARELGLPVLAPESLKDEVFVEQLKELNVDLFAVIAFRILPRKLLGIPRLGSINVHGSLLPKYRGAAPIQHALFNGETVTGLSAFYLKPAVDTGDVINQMRIPIHPDDTYTTLAQKMSGCAGEFLLETLREIEAGEVIPQKQEESQATLASKISNADRELDWSLPAEKLVNRIRGLAEHPGAYTTLNGKRLKILEARVAETPPGETPELGALAVRGKRILVGVAAGDALELRRLQPEGKKVMTAQEVINGQFVRDGSLLRAGQERK